MDFVTHLPWTSRGHDAVWVIVDRLTKSAHFLVVRMTFTLEEFYKLYIQEIVAEVYRALRGIQEDWYSYQLALPPSLLSVHAVFHVSMLRKYTPDLTHVVD